jgi:putative transposase
MSQGHSHLNRATWECKYHVVFTPKYRKKALFGQIRQHLGTVFRELARRKECQIEEGARPCAYADIDPAEIFSSER